MKLFELFALVDDLTDTPPLRHNEVMVRDKEGNLHKIEQELSLAIYGNESIVIIDIKDKE